MILAWETELERCMGDDCEQKRVELSFHILHPNTYITNPQVDFQFEDFFVK